MIFTHQIHSAPGAKQHYVAPGKVSVSKGRDSKQKTAGPQPKTVVRK